MGAVLSVAPMDTPALTGTADALPDGSGTIIPLAAESTPPEDGASLAPAASAEPVEQVVAEAPAPAVEPVAAAPEAPQSAAVQSEAVPTIAALAPAKPQPVSIVAYATPRPNDATGRAKLDRLIAHYASVYEVPETLVRRVVKRESNFRPSAYNKGHWGLMQIKHATARGMGYKGNAEGLLDADTNLRYAVKYLRGAYMVAGGDHDQTVRFYARGYYYDAKRAGMLEATGLGRDRVRKRRPG